MESFLHPYKLHLKLFQCGTKIEPTPGFRSKSAPFQTHIDRPETGLQSAYKHGNFKAVPMDRGRIFSVSFVRVQETFQRNQ